MTFVIAAAGTGGHVNPALAVAEALVERGVERKEILFLGGDRFEATEVPRAGFPFAGFELTRLHRSFSLQNLRIPLVVRRTSSAMADHIRRVGGRVVLGMSGYVTVPAAIAAGRSGTPFVLQEQNAHPGIAARFASRRAGRTFLGLPGRAERLPRSVLVGNPLRPEIRDFDRQALRERALNRYGIHGDGPVLGVLGGSQGARVLNEMVASIEAGVDGAAGIVHLTGRAAISEMRALAEKASLPWVCLPYESDMEYFYAAADLVVCRAGAMTVSELAATGTPSVLVPLARVGQGWNARSLGSVGGAEIVEQEAVASLPVSVRALLADSASRETMSRAAKSQALPDAAAVMADHLIEVAHG